MPKVSLYLVRLALLYLVAGFTIGSLLLADKGLRIGTWLWVLRPLHIEFLLFGWMVQLTFGVAAWILPRTATRSSLRPVVVAGVLLNAGVWLVGIGGGLSGSVGLVLAGRICEIGAIGAFGYHVWPRVRPFGKMPQKEG